MRTACFARYKTEAQLISAHLDVQVPLLSALLTNIPAKLEILVARMVHKEVEKRPATAGEVRRLLAEILREEDRNELSRPAPAPDAPTDEMPLEKLQAMMQEVHAQRVAEAMTLMPRSVDPVIALGVADTDPSDTSIFSHRAPEPEDLGPTPSQEMRRAPTRTMPPTKPSVAQARGQGGKGGTTPMGSAFSVQVARFPTVPMVGALGGFRVSSDASSALKPDSRPGKRHGWSELDWPLKVGVLASLVLIMATVLVVLGTRGDGGGASSHDKAEPEAPQAGASGSTAPVPPVGTPLEEPAAAGSADGAGKAQSLPSAAPTSFDAPTTPPSRSSSPPKKAAPAIPVTKPKSSSVPHVEM